MYFFMNLVFIGVFISRITELQDMQKQGVKWHSRRRSARTQIGEKSESSKKTLLEREKYNLLQ